MGNPLASLMLVIWPVVCLFFIRNMKIERALIWCILGGYLLLPPKTAFDMPLMPALDKVSIPNLSILLLIFFATKEKLRLWPESNWAKIWVCLLVVSSIPTVLTNDDPIIFRLLEGAGPITFFVDWLPGQSVRDLGSAFNTQLVTLVPFLLARQYLSSEDGMRELLLAFMVGALIYSVPSLIEIRLSPQMNVWIYGFFQHSFEQMMRAGGFRPIVFLQHGLWLAIYISIGLVSAAALLRVAPQPERRKYWMIVGYLFMLLVLCKSAASIMYGLLLVPVVLIIPQRLQIALSLVFALTALTYPVMRNLQVIPLDSIITQIRTVNPERAHSLNYRFENEEILLERAAIKPVFGWGGWGRSLERDSETGRITSVPDGRWIIIFGNYGWVGYIAEFGLLGLPILLMGWLTCKNRTMILSPYIGPLCLLLGITLIDMLLNATLTPLTWLTAGSVLGYAEKMNPNRYRPPVHHIGLKTAMDHRDKQRPRTII